MIVKLMLLGQNMILENPLTLEVLITGRTIVVYRTKMNLAHVPPHTQIRHINPLSVSLTFVCIRS